MMLDRGITGIHLFSFSVDHGEEVQPAFTIIQPRCPPARDEVNELDRQAIAEEAA